MSYFFPFVEKVFLLKSLSLSWGLKILLFYFLSVEKNFLNKLKIILLKSFVHSIWKPAFFPLNNKWTLNEILWIFFSTTVDDMFKKGFSKPAQWTASTHKAFVPVTFGNWQEMNTSPETENIFLEAFISLVLSSSLMLHVGLVLKDYHSAVVWGQKKIQHSWVGSSQDVGPQQWDNAASQILLGWALTKLASVSVPSAAPPQHLSPLLFFFFFPDLSFIFIS